MLRALYLTIPLMGKRMSLVVFMPLDIPIITALLLTGSVAMAASASLLRFSFTTFPPSGRNQIL